jgi:nucleoside-diphosphate-sugar epimerase
MKNKKTTGELSIQYMDYEKINHYLGWQPKYKFTKTLPTLFKWYKKYFRKR